MEAVQRLSSNVYCSLNSNFFHIGNKLGEFDAHHLRDMMQENTTLKCLNLSHNEFRDAGGVMLAEGIGNW